MEITYGLNYNTVFKMKHVCKLYKSIYGLKKNPKCWYEYFSKKVIKLGLKKDINKPCLFTWRKNDQIIILVLYVGDILLAGNNPEKLNLIRQKLYLDIDIFRNRKNKVMKLTKLKFVNKMLKRCNMKDSKPRRILMETRQVKNTELKYFKNI